MTYAQKYAHLEAPLKAIAEAHPEYGYRRATAELRETYGHRVNRKVVERLHRLWDLPLRRVRRPKPSAIRRAIDAAGPRANLLSRRRKAEIGPLEVIYTDFTELRYADGTRKAWLIPLLDHARTPTGRYQSHRPEKSVRRYQDWSLRNRYWCR